MSATAEIEKKFTTDNAYPVKDEAVTSETSSQAIYIDPEKEKAVLKKFDKYTVPASFVFMLLCALDRNNVSEPAPVEVLMAKAILSSAMHACLGSMRISASMAVNSATSIHFLP